MNKSDFISLNRIAEIRAWRARALLARADEVIE
jgi:hypothetical protein